MLSIIICSISPERLQEISQNIHATIGVEHEIIAIDNREKCWSIARAYNEGARQARYPYLFFVHEDVKFHSQDWGTVVAEKLAEPSGTRRVVCGSCSSGRFRNVCPKRGMEGISFR